MFQTLLWQWLELAWQEFFRHHKNREYLKQGCLSSNRSVGFRDSASSPYSKPHLLLAKTLHHDSWGLPVSVQYVIILVTPNTRKNRDVALKQHRVIPGHGQAFC